MAPYVLYVSCEANAATLMGPVALALRDLEPGAQQALFDPFEALSPHKSGGASPAEHFVSLGLGGRMLGADGAARLEGLNHADKAAIVFLDEFEARRPDVVVVGHEYGYGFFAVQVARHLGIPTVHMQHGIWGPEKYLNYHELPFEVRCEANWPPREMRDLLLAQGAVLRAQVRLLRAALRRARDWWRRMRRDRKAPADLVERIPAPLRQAMRHVPLCYPLNADRMLLFGEYYLEQLAHFRPQYPAEAATVVGYPRGDALGGGSGESPGLDAEALCGRYGLPPKTRFMVYFYTQFQELPVNYSVRHHPTDALIEAVRAARAVDPELGVIVLVHPVYRYAHYRDEVAHALAAAGLDRAVVNRTHGDVYDLCRAAKLVVGVKSSAMYDAMQVGAPVLLQLYVLSQIYDPQHVEAGACAPVFVPFHLPQRMRAALTDEDYRAAMRAAQRKLCVRLLGEPDGKAGMRAAQAIIDMARERAAKETADA